jgi:hypothetical protein
VSGGTVPQDFPLVQIWHTVCAELGFTQISGQFSRHCLLNCCDSVTIIASSRKNYIAGIVGPAHPQSYYNYLRNARNLRAIRAIYRNGEPVAERCEHGEVVRSVRRGRRYLAAVLDMPVTLGHVRLHGLAPVPLTSPRCFQEFPVGRMTPLACRAAPAPAAAPARSSHHAPHRVRRCVLSKCITLSDSLARRTGGSDSPLMRLLTFAPLSRCSLGPLGHGPATRFAPPALERDGQS